MQTVTNKPLKLRVIMLNVAIFNAVAPLELNLTVRHIKNLLKILDRAENVDKNFRSFCSAKIIKVVASCFKMS